jgi:hypothetical protein
MQKLKSPKQLSKHSLPRSIPEVWSLANNEIGS